jgi:hypothetical protein
MLRATGWPSALHYFNEPTNSTKTPRRPILQPRHNRWAERDWVRPLYSPLGSVSDEMEPDPISILMAVQPETTDFEPN